MNIKFKFKPYADSCEEDIENIKDFSDEEWDLVYDVFFRVVRNFKNIYNDIKVKIERKNREIVINIEKEEFSEEEFEYFLDVLTGHQEDNIIIFDNIEYVIRGKLNGEEDNIKNKAKTKISNLDRYNDMIKELNPELIL